MPEIKTHPLMFVFRDVISGNGFLAGITLSGRAVMVQEPEDGQWWLYGVRPSPIAQSGKSPLDTFSRFRTAYKEVLFDFADEHRSFDDFKATVERFFYEPDVEEEQRWEEAVRLIRACKIEPPEPFASLPREAPERRPAQITVERLDKEKTRYQSSDNVSDTFLLPMAA